MKKKIIVLSILAVSTIGTIASAASFAGAVLPEGVASGTLYESGTKGAIATTTLETTKSGAKAYVYLEAKSGTTKLKSTNKTGVAGSTSYAKTSCQHNAATNFWSTHRASGSTHSKSLSLKV